MYHAEGMEGSKKEERTDGIMQTQFDHSGRVVRHLTFLIPFSFSWCGDLSHTTPQPTLRQNALHFLFVLPAPESAINGTTAPVRNPFLFFRTHSTLEDRIAVSEGWDDRGMIAVLIQHLTALTRKRGGKVSEVIHRLTPESAQTVRPGARKL